MVAIEGVAFWTCSCDTKDLILAQQGDKCTVLVQQPGYNSCSQRVQLVTTPPAQPNSFNASRQPNLAARPATAFDVSYTHSMLCPCCWCNRKVLGFWPLLLLVCHHHSIQLCNWNQYSRVKSCDYFAASAAAACSTLSLTHNVPTASRRLQQPTPDYLNSTTVFKFEASTSPMHFVTTAHTACAVPAAAAAAAAGAATAFQHIPSVTR